MLSPPGGFSCPPAARTRCAGIASRAGKSACGRPCHSPSDCSVSPGSSPRPRGITLRKIVWAVRRVRDSGVTCQSAGRGRRDGQRACTSAPVPAAWFRTAARPSRRTAWRGNSPPPERGGSARTGRSLADAQQRAAHPGLMELPREQQCRETQTQFRRECASRWSHWITPSKEHRACPRKHEPTAASRRRAHRSGQHGDGVEHGGEWSDAEQHGPGQRFRTRPWRRMRLTTPSATHQPMIIRLMKNRTKTGPEDEEVEGVECPGEQRSPVTPTSMRMIDMPISAATNSHGRSGLTKTWPRLRDHNSSRNEIAIPIWLRRQTSHSSTPPSSVETATAAPEPGARRGTTR